MARAPSVHATKVSENTLVPLPSKPQSQGAKKRKFEGEPIRQHRKKVPTNVSNMLQQAPKDGGGADATPTSHVDM